jgi:hypothetical protein
VGRITLPRVGLAISTGYGKEPGRVSWCEGRAGPRHGYSDLRIEPRAPWGK